MNGLDRRTFLASSLLAGTVLVNGPRASAREADEEHHKAFGPGAMPKVEMGDHTRPDSSKPSEND